MSDHAYGITPTELVDRIAPIAKEVLQRAEDFASLNRFGGIEWPNRERLRAVQGHYAKIDDLMAEIIWSIGDDHAADTAETIWGPADLDE